MKEVMEVEIIDEDINGNGIAKENGIVIFVKNALLNERVKIRITNKKKRFYEAEILEIINKSPKRINPVCKYYKQCGGCNLAHINIEEELLKKQKYLERKFPDIKINKIINANEYNYRNKVTLHIKNKRLGYYEEETNNLIPIDYCYLLDDDINKIIEKLKTLDLTNVTEVMIRKTINNNETLLTFYGNINKNEIKDIDVTSLYLNDELIKGKPYITEIINNLKYTIYKDSFFQVNTSSMIKLYDVIKAYAECGNKLLDLYCGTGTIGMYSHENFKEIIGVELNKESIKNANINKKLNNINNITFINGDASIINDDFDVVIVDPPRKGLSKQVIKNLLSKNIKKLIYVSCNPNTLKNDLNLLKAKYKVEEITPVNMFPKTKHVECVSLLSLK